MKRIALFALLIVFAASCRKDYVCTCRALDDGTIITTERMDNTTRENAQTRCDEKGKTKVPTTTIRYQICTVD